MRNGTAIHDAFLLNETQNSYIAVETISFPRRCEQPPLRIATEPPLDSRSPLIRGCNQREILVDRF